MLLGNVSVIIDELKAVGEALERIIPGCPRYGKAGYVIGISCHARATSRILIIAPYKLDS